MAITPETLNSNALLDESVKSRVGDGNLIELTKMSDSGDIEKFVTKIYQCIFTDRPKNITIISI